MENYDKIESQFKNAAEKSEASDFPNMDKVWNRVEEKLDKKVLKKQNKLWKKIAVAASILLVASVGYQLLKSDNEIETPQNDIVILDTLQENSDANVVQDNAIISRESNESKESILRKDAVIILEKDISSQPQVAIVEKDEVINNNITSAETVDDNLKKDVDDRSNGYLARRKFDAVGVQQAPADAETVSKKDKQVSQQKNDPLLIINEKAITSNNANTYSKKTKEELAKIDSEDLQTVVYLKEPLYIIDGKEYTEEEMFGKNPTSPYAPLSEQEIVTTKVLQGKEAIAAYGKKGEKGVLVITTKNGRPVKKIKSVKN